MVSGECRSEGCTKELTYEENVPLFSMSKDAGVSSSLIRVPLYEKLDYRQCSMRRVGVFGIIHVKQA
jgi:hypothetical protein